MSYINPHNSQAGNVQNQSPLLRVCYNDRRALTASPTEYAALENAVRRLFTIPIDQPLTLLTKVPEFGDDRLEIDPEMWSLIKPRVNTIWILPRELHSGTASVYPRSPPLTVFVRVPEDISVPMLVRPTDTIGSLRTRIQSGEEVICDFDPQLLFAGLIQHEGRTLAGCGITANDIIYCVDNAGAPIRILVRELTDRIHNLDVTTSWSIEHVKNVVLSRTSIPMDQQRLLFSGRRLEDSRTLANYNIGNHAQIDLILRLRGGKPVIYLFSPNAVDANVSLRLLPSWSFSALYPVTKIQDEQGGGELVSWDVLVNPEGTLKDKYSGSDISYLYWEAKTNPIRKPISPPHSRPGSPTEFINANVSQEIFDPAYPIITPTNSIVLTIADIPLYLDKSLLALGLHTEARTSFITYWLPDLLHYEFIALRFLPQYAYEAAAPLKVEPTPVEVVRIFMLWRGVLPCEIEEEDHWKEAQWRAENMNVMEWRTIVGLRTGTGDEGLRVLEWGGMEVK